MDTNPPQTTPPQPQGVPLDRGGRTKTLRNLAWGILLFAGLVLALCISFIVAVVENGWPWDYESWGSLTGATLGPFVMACIAVGIYYEIRKAHRTRRRVASQVVLWTLIFTFFTFFTFLTRQSASPQWPQSKEEMGQLMGQAYREAAGIIPRAQQSPDKRVALLRGYYQDLISFHQRYEQEAAQFQTQEMGNLYQPSSFRDRKTLEETIRQLKKMAAVEEKYASLDPVFTTLKTRLVQMDWPSKGAKRAFLKGMEGTMSEGNQKRLAVYRREREWIDASVDLYTLVLDNSSAFLVRQNVVRASDDKTQDLFNQKLSRAVELRNGFLQARNDFERQQKGKLTEFGLTPSDSGAPRNSR